MLGNVKEWCHDGLRRYTADAVVDPIGPTGAGADRVFRGSSWVYPVQHVRAAFRSEVPPGSPYADLGFRCASAGPSK
jgi:formylglycine-generating enzyme